MENIEFACVGNRSWLGSARVSRALVKLRFHYIFAGARWAKSYWMRIYRHSSIENYVLSSNKLLLLHSSQDILHGTAVAGKNMLANTGRNRLNQGWAFIQHSCSNYSGVFISIESFSWDSFAKLYTFRINPFFGWIRID